MINVSLKANRWRRTEEVDSNIEAILASDPSLHKESWHWMKSWYKAAADCTPPPNRVTLKQITL